VVKGRGKMNRTPTLETSPLDADYRQLIEAFPLVSIQDDAHLDEAVAVIHRLLDQGPLSSGEEAYLGALTDLVETYEDAHVVIPDVSGVRLLRHLMDANDLTLADLAPLLGTPSMAADVLTGKRRMTLAHIQRLSERFKLPADAFIERPAARDQDAI